MGKAANSKHSKTDRNKERYCKLQEKRRRFFYNFQQTSDDKYPCWPLPLSKIRLPQERGSASVDILTPTSSVLSKSGKKSSIQQREEGGEMEKEEEKREEDSDAKKAAVLFDQSVSKLRTYIDGITRDQNKSKLKLERIVDGNINVIRNIMKELGKNERQRIYKLKNAKKRSYHDILLAALQANVPNALVQTVLHRMKSMMPDKDEEAERLIESRNHITDIYGAVEESLLPFDSIYGFASELESNNVERLQELEDKIYSEEPLYMDLVRPSNGKAYIRQRSETMEALFLSQSHNTESSTNTEQTTIEEQIWHG